MQLPQTEQKVRLFYRGTLSQASEARLDRQGRVTIPRKLLERAGIRDRMIIIGALDRLELWNPEVYQTGVHAASAADVERFAHQIFG